MSLTSEFKLPHAGNSPEPFLLLRKALYYSSGIAKSNVSIRLGVFLLLLNSRQPQEPMRHAQSTLSHSVSSGSLKLPRE